MKNKTIWREEWEVKVEEKKRREKKDKLYGIETTTFKLISAEIIWDWGNKEKYMKS